MKVVFRIHSGSGGFLIHPSSKHLIPELQFALKEKAKNKDTHRECLIADDNASEVI